MNFLFAFIPMLILVLLNTGDSSGSDEGPEDCAGLHGDVRRAERRHVTYDGVEMIEGQNDKIEDSESYR